MGIGNKNKKAKKRKIEIRKRRQDGRKGSHVF